MFYWFTVLMNYFFHTNKDKRGRTGVQNLAWLLGGGNLTHWQACRFIAFNNVEKAKEYIESIKKG